MHTIFTYIAKAIAVPIIAILTMSGYSIAPQQIQQAPQMQQSPKVGAAPQFTAAAPTTLYGSGVSSSDTSIRVNELTTPNGYLIQTADVVGGATNVFYATLEPASVRKETISCTAITQNSDGSAYMTGCSRGLLFTYPYTASTTLARAHSGGSPVVLSNSPQLYNDIITYVNNSMAAGTVDASPTAKGVVEVASANEAAAHAQNGSGNTSAYLALTTNVASSTCLSAATQVIVSSTTNGFIDSSCLPSTILKALTFGSNATFSGTQTTFSTTTTFYGNTSGTNIIAVSTSTFNFLGNTGEKTIISGIIKGGTFATTSIVRINIPYQGTIGDSPTLKLYIGGTNVATKVLGAVPPATPVFGTVRWDIAATSSPNSQIDELTIASSSVVYQTSYSQINTSSDVSVAFTVTGSGSSNTTWTSDYATIEKLR